MSKNSFDFYDNKNSILKILESIPDPFFALDHNWKFVYLNSEAEKFLRKNQDEIIGKNIWNIYPNSLNSKFYINYKKAFKEKKIINFETLYKENDKWFQVRANPHRNILFVYFTDITNIKRYSERFQSMVLASSQIFWSTDSDGNIVEELPEWCKFTGQTPKESFGMGWLKSIHPDDRERVKEVWLKSVNEKLFLETEYRLRRFDGIYIHTAVTAIPIFKENGEIREWVGTNRDITQEKLDKERIEEESNINNTLYKIGITLAAQLDTKSVIQTVVDECTKLINAKYGAFFYTEIGLDGEYYKLFSLSGASKNEFENMPMPRNTLIFEPTFSGLGIIRLDDVTQDPRYGKNEPYYGMPEGHVDVKSYMAIPVISRTGEVLGGLFFGHSETGIFSKKDEKIVSGVAAQAAIALDNANLYNKIIDDKNKAEKIKEELRVSNLELEKKNSELQQFAYVASHDLQEPLRSLTSFATLLERKYKDKLDGDALEYLKIIGDSSKRMKSLIEDLLEYSRVGEKEYITINLNEIIENVLFNLNSSIKNNEVAINFPKLPKVKSDKTHATQLFQNLISNSIKYKSEERKPEVIINFQERENDFLFSISDNGIGIKKDYFDKIFIIFQRLHNNNKYEGTGIGLSTCKKIVELHNGKIWLESEENKGTTFYFTISK